LFHVHLEFLEGLEGLCRQEFQMDQLCLFLQADQEGLFLLFLLGVLELQLIL
jgi:hypothetical protein